MSKNTLIAGLTLLSIIFVTANNAVAEIAPTARSLTIHRTNTPETTTERGNDDRQAYKENEESLRYTKLAWEAQQRGEKETALAYYTHILHQYIRTSINRDQNVRKRGCGRRGELMICVYTPIPHPKNKKILNQSKGELILQLNRIFRQLIMNKHFVLVSIFALSLQLPIAGSTQTANVQQIAQANTANDFADYHYLQFA
jgi:hypothetical protein